ncbi:MAG: hotdog fold thioesterase, partial [Bacteroidota bacterium]
MTIWKNQLDLEAINQFNGNSMAKHLGITFTEIGEDYLVATMPIDEKTKQPFGLLHGGASAAMAETMGSVASFFCIEDINKQAAVGVEINANHLRSATSGLLKGVVKPYKVGRNMHVWNIEMFDKKD